MMAQITPTIVDTFTLFSPGDYSRKTYIILMENGECIKVHLIRKTI